MTKHNPVMNSYYKENYWADGEGIELDERNVKIAFTIEDTYGVKKQKSDPRYVKWWFRLHGFQDGEIVQHIYPYHRCTWEDIATFYPVEKQSSDLLQTLMDDPDRGLFCIEFDPNES